MHGINPEPLPLWVKSGHGGYFDSKLICCSTTTGSVNANVEPWPGCDSTQIRPPCISIMRFDMARPRPVPPFLRVMALSAYGQITLKNGRVEQSNFDNYRVLRINEVPLVEVHIIKSTEAPGGIGEPGTAAVSPAVTNAIFAATGKRLRKLPVDPGELRSV